jgi:hypothetical protein
MMMMSPKLMMFVLLAIFKMYFFYAYLMTSSHICVCMVVRVLCKKTPSKLESSRDDKLSTINLSRFLRIELTSLT